MVKEGFWKNVSGPTIEEKVEFDTGPIPWKAS
jgi:hypothetical protein